MDRQSAYDFDLGSYKVEETTGPLGQRKFVFHFPVTFKEAANQSRTLYFANYFIWLGKLREFIAQPVYDRLVEYFSSGKWGMVTNHAETRILGEAQSGEIIHGSIWLDRISGKEKSTLEFHFEWHKKSRNNKKQLIAFSKMTTSWVAIRGHGIVEVQPFPKFAADYSYVLAPKKNPDKEVEHASVSDLQPDPGKEIYSEPAGPVRQAALLREKAFDTCLEDSNLVGNIYFSNYYVWQGRIRDHFLHDIAPQYFVSPGEKGEFRCVYCKIHHLSEAMPYERILVKMYRTKVYQRGIHLYFEYYRRQKDGSHQKLGYGFHEAVWYEPVYGSPEWQQASIPEKILNHLIPTGHKSQQVNNVIGWAAQRNDYDVIVVGAGIAGLTAASLLAKNGARVVVAEQYNKPGGFCTSWKRQVRVNGNLFRYVFDVGVHDIFGLGPHGNVRALLRELDIEGAIEWRRMDQQYILSDLKITVPRNIEDYVELLCRTFPRERQGITAFFREVHSCFAELYSQVSAKVHISRWVDVPFLQMLEEFISDQRLKKILSILFYYITDDLTEIKSLTVIPMYGYYYDGGYYPVGSSQRFSNLLAKKITEHGGEILLNSPVSRITSEKKRITGVELEGGRKLHTKLVISNADVRRTFLDFIDHSQLTQSYLTHINQLNPSASAFTVSLGVDFIPDIEPVTMLIDNEEILCILAPSKVDPSLAPQGHAVINLMTLIPRKEAVTWTAKSSEYQKRKKQMGDRCIALAEKAVPGLSKHIICRYEASPSTFKRFAWTTDGAIFGTVIDQWKPALETPIQGLYLASASISARPGVADAVHAGKSAADAILKKL